MSVCFAERGGPDAITLLPIEVGAYRGWLEGADPVIRTWLDALALEPTPGAVAVLPNPKGGRPREAILIVSGPDDLWSWGGAPQALPPGDYALPPATDRGTRRQAALGWGLGSWRFDRYKPTTGPNGTAAPTRRLVVGDREARRAAQITLDGVILARDLITTPASDMGPAELAEAAQALAKAHKASCEVIEGDALLQRNFPLIHAVGRASTRAPRLIDITWGRKRDPYVAIVGKGVCFDTGGLDLKGASAMKMMKKDMGGAALALGLASMIMDSRLPVRLRVLIPAVENAVSGDAFRPLDILTSRKGLTVEIGNTDAEGRLVLADALTYAQEDATPDLIIDFATLTGAARVALGTELPALFCNQDILAESLIASGREVQDPSWRMPLHQPYRNLIEPRIADLSNAPDHPYAGAITAALFLESFIESGVPWAHYDVMAWTLSAKAGRPEGGEAQAVRGVFRYLESRYPQG